MKKRTPYQEWIISRVNETKTARVRHDQAFNSYEIVDGLYRTVIRGDSFRLMEGEFVLIDQIGRYRYFRLKD